jgi:hypothetical protein
LEEQQVSEQSDSEDDFESADSELDSDDEPPAPVKKKKLVTKYKNADKVEKRMRQMQLLSDSDDSSDVDDNNSRRRHRSRSKSRRGKKSGRTKTANEYAKKELEWPQFFIYRGPTRDKPSFDQLSVQEFAGGFLAQMAQSRASEDTKAAMVEYLQRMMFDAQTYPWEVVRNVHGVVMQHREQKRITWKSKAEIGELRLLYLVQMAAEFREGTGATHTSHGATSMQSASKYTAPKGLRYCTDYQRG